MDRNGTKHTAHEVHGPEPRRTHALGQFFGGQELLSGIGQVGISFRITGDDTPQQGHNAVQVEFQKGLQQVVARWSGVQRNHTPARF